MRKLISRRDLLTGAAVATAYATLPKNAEALTAAQRLVLLGQGYSPAALALFARMSPQPSQARMKLINKLIVSLISAGIWTKLDAFYVLANFSSQASLLNWVSTSFNLSIASGSPPFVVDAGYTPGISSDNITSGFNPATAGGQFQQNNCCIFVRSNTNARFNGGSCIGNGINTSGGGANINPWNNSVNNGSYSMNGATNTNQLAPGTAQAFFCSNRSVSTGFDVYQNGSLLGNITQTSQAPTNSAFQLLNVTAVNTTNSARQLSFAGWGASLTSSQAAALYNAIAAYMAGIGLT